MKIPSFINGILTDQRKADLFEKVVAATLLSALVYRVMPDAIAERNFFLLAVILMECLIVFFILIRRPSKSISMNAKDWVFGFCGTILPLLIVKPEVNLASQYAGIAVLSTVLMVVGFAMNFSAKLSLRRSFGIVAANRGVKVGGPYMFMRHPMYAGYLCTQFGFLLSNPSMWNISIYSAAFFFQVKRMDAEERILGEDPTYADYMTRTRYRILPGVY